MNRAQLLSSMPTSSFAPESRALESARIVKPLKSLQNPRLVLGRNASMQRLDVLVSRVAPSAATVLITGETGTGKDIWAREIHLRGPRAEEPLVRVNCAALPESLCESELFGHRRGAFTGALNDRRGLFERASGGTLLLDEVGELAPAVQAKLLCALEDGEILPLGSERPVSVNVRVIAATNRDLRRDVEQGLFRRDLFFRLSAFPLCIPPLRQCREDIPLLVQRFLSRIGEASQKRIRGIDDRALALLLDYAFPGNVRELLHIVERACIVAEDDSWIGPSHLPEELGVPASERNSGAEMDALDEGVDACDSLRNALLCFERRLITQTLERVCWNRTKAAKRLNVPLRTFMEKLSKLGIQGPRIE